MHKVQRVSSVTGKQKEKSKRSYDNSSRSAKSSGTQLAIIEGLVELLAERRGGEVQIQEVAERTGINKRTIFRFFKDKKSLHEAMDEYLLSYLSAGTQQLATLNFVDFGRNAIRLFEENESITLAYVLSPLGEEARVLLRKKLNDLMVRKLAEEYKIKVTKKNFPKIAFIVNLVNARVWYGLRTEHDLSSEEIQDALGWALGKLVKDL